MDAVRVGRSVRSIRIRLGKRQADVADDAGLSRGFVSKIERGLIRHADLDRLERACRALGADLDVRVRWRGEALDRLLDEAHSGLVDGYVALLGRLGWETAVEVTFNDYGERGSVDILAWHARSGSLLVIEVKSILVDTQATLASLDRKTRVGPKIGAAKGWRTRSVSCLLVVQEGSTNRGRVERLASTFATALPDRGAAIRGWLRTPRGRIAGLIFFRSATPGSTRRQATGRLRVRRGRRTQNVP